MPSNPRAIGPGLLRLVADDVRQRVFGGLAREEARARPSGNVAEVTRVTAPAWLSCLKQIWGVATLTASPPAAGGER
jgi:hypothetical protein